jgi:carbon storage regulator
VLVIRRRPGETLVIGEDIEIEILDLTPSQVKLGIRAPKAVSVLRKEIRVVGQQNRSAARGVSAPAMQRLLQTLKNSPRSPISPV